MIAYLRVENPLTRLLPATSILVVKEFTATNSVAIIWKIKKVLSIFYCLFGIYIKFWTFCKWTVRARNL